MDGTGGVRLTGCASFKVKYNYTSDFAAGDRLYVKKKARKGILERVVIKKANRVLGFNYVAWNYVDTTNRVWLDGELIILADAQEYVALYQKQYAAAYQSIGPCINVL